MLTERQSDKFVILKLTQTAITKQAAQIPIYKAKEAMVRKIPVPIIPLDFFMRRQSLG